MKRLIAFGLFVAVFTGIPFLLAGWLALLTEQPPAIKLLGVAVLALAGLWNLWRAWNKIARPRHDPPMG
jgi:hypothetical protein